MFLPTLFQKPWGLSSLLSNFDRVSLKITLVWGLVCDIRDDIRNLSLDRLVSDGREDLAIKRLLPIEEKLRKLTRTDDLQLEFGQLHTKINDLRGLRECLGETNRAANSARASVEANERVRQANSEQKVRKLKSLVEQTSSLSNIIRAAFTPAETVVALPPVPMPTSKHYLIEGRTTWVEGDSYWVGNKLIHIPELYLSLCEEERDSPSRIVLRGHFKFIRRSKCIDENWSLVDTELYEADPEYYESLARHRRDSQRASDAKAANALHRDRMRKQYAAIYNTLATGTDSADQAARFLQLVVKTNNPGPRSVEIAELE